MLDVLLLNPAEKIRLFSYILPLGLAGIGALLEQNGFRVQAIDFALYAGDFERELKTLKPVIVGIGGTTATRHYSYQIARLVKKISPNTIVVYGGVHASFTAAETLENVKEIDYVIKGEGEYSLLLLSEKLIRGKEIKVHDISGLSYRVNGKIVDNPSCRIENLNALPIAARHLFPPYTPFKLDFLGLDADVIITSRGCPAHCVFCSASRMFPGGVRYRSADHIRAEVEYILSRQKIMALKLFDSTFTANLDHVRSFCAMIKPYRLKWECEIRADEELNEDVLSMMHDAGCCYVNMGLETSNQALLQKIAKNIIVPHADRIMDICKKLTIKTKVFFTFGHIDQTYQECLADLAYMRTKKTRLTFLPSPWECGSIRELLWRK